MQHEMGLETKEDYIRHRENLMKRRVLSIKLFSFLLMPLMSFVLYTLKDTVWFSRLVACCLLSVVMYILTSCLIPFFAESLKKKGLTGKDLNKLNSTFLLPECLGLVPAFVFIVSCTLIQLLISEDSNTLLEFNAGLFSITCMTFLGFVDDVLDLRWRYKIILPLFAGLPFAIAYRGSSFILLPRFIQKALNIPSLINLGYIYRFYLILLTLFCTNSINIYAGINGLEVGQTLVMCIFVILYSLTALGNFGPTFFAIKPHQQIKHFLSLALSIPFFSTCLALMSYNWYPSCVFVGDTFTYFAGIYFSLVGGLGHFSKMILLLFIPQMINFLLSLPQLLKLIPCPRHRIPRISHTTGLLHPTPNLTLINLTLWLLGPMEERKLCIVLLVIQSLSCIGGLLLTHYVIETIT